MSAINSSLLRAAQLYTLIDEQIKTLSEELRNLKNARNALQIQPDVVTNLIHQLNDANEEIQKGMAAKKKVQDSRCCSCRPKARLSWVGCSDSCRTVSLILVRACAGVATGAGIITSFFYDGQDKSSRAPALYVSLAVVVVAVIVDIIFWYDQKVASNAEKAAESAIRETRDVRMQQQTSLELFLGNLNSFKSEQSTETLSHCLKSYQAVSPKYQSLLPNCEELVNDLAPSLPEQDPCKKLLKSLRGIAYMSKPPPADRAKVKGNLEELAMRVIVSGANDEGEEKRTAEDSGFSELDFSSEYNQKWSQLEALLGVSVKSLELEGLRFNRQRQCEVSARFSKSEGKRRVEDEMEESNPLLDDSASRPPQRPLPSMKLHKAHPFPIPQHSKPTHITITPPASDSSESTVPGHKKRAIATRTPFPTPQINSDSSERLPRRFRFAVSHTQTPFAPPGESNQPRTHEGNVDGARGDMRLRVPGPEHTVVISGSDSPRLSPHSESLGLSMTPISGSDGRQKSDPPKGLGDNKEGTE